ncbi:putative integrase [Vibrio ishigakensis]|uniref:Putative integrase n=1 Tax=Vibrio ishigakensis TaxID=1481914 RepID=A0A0B8QF30_9VIBR|nr:putative integrase [Vibrio ishigakensis]
MINKYLSNLNALVNTYKNSSLPQFTNHEGYKVSFDDLVWYHTNSEGRKARVLCCVHDGIRRQHDRSLTNTSKLPSPYDHLLKVFIIDVFNLEKSAAHRSTLIAEARYILSNLSNAHLYTLTTNILTSLYHDRNSDHAHYFIHFCKKHKLVPSTLNLIGKHNRDRTGEGTLKTNLEKLPNESSIIALGDIYTKVYESVDDDGNLCPGGLIDVGDAFVIAMCCLALGSPNRAKAEQTVLEKQKLKKLTKDGKTVHSLVWKGSKGFEDNRKHVLSSMASAIDKCVRFFSRFGEPARILNSFYANPNQTLRILTKEIEIDPQRLSNLDLDNIPSMFQLGYALGFYKINQTVDVINDSMKHRLENGAVVYTSAQSKPFHCDAIYQVNLSHHPIKKPIWQLSQDDLVYIGQGKDAAFNTLLGYSYNKETSFIKNGAYTISELQTLWIKHYTTEYIPEFPLCYGKSENFVDMRHALFSILGCEMPTTPSFSGGTSFYSPVSISKLEAYFNNRLGKNKQTSIFSKYGYCPSLGLTSHQLRHYSNTLADLSHIPASFITAWSGRKNVRHTDTYIHTDDGFKSERVKAILSDDASTAISIRIKSLQEVSESTNIYATETSTGVCSQNLIVSPCDYLNDFISQCFLCPEACYIAGDDKAIELLEKDCQYQKRRLELVSDDARLKSSNAMQQWFKIHFFNTEVMSSLIKVMKDSPQGNTIRYARSASEFRITDISSGDRHTVKFELPNLDHKLDLLIKDTNHSRNNFEDNEDLSDLLSMFGLSSEDL